MAKIDIEIKSDGKIRATIREEKGTKCVKYIDSIEKLTGAKIHELRYTDEYNEEVTIEVKEKVKVEEDCIQYTHMINT